jgi:hypothetical protein
MPNFPRLHAADFGNGNPKSARRATNHFSAAENRSTKSGFSFANGDCVTHMRQGFPAPKSFRGTVAQNLPSRAYCLVTSSFEVGEFHSYTVNFGAIIFDMEIVSGHDNTPISAGGSAGLSLPPTPGDHCR